MIKLYGFAVSNYYNMVKQTLEEKAISYEEISAIPSQGDEFKAKSPMGKVPCIETDHGFISETAAILDYLEESYPNPRLFPAEVFARSKVREIMRITELYIELPARRHFQHLFFSTPRNDAAFTEVKPILENGVSALSHLVKPAPFLCGAEMTYADIYAYHTFGYANAVTTKLYDWDIIAAIPGLKASLAAMAARPSTKRVDADQQAMMAARAKAK